MGGVIKWNVALGGSFPSNDLSVIAGNQDKNESFMLYVGNNNPWNNKPWDLDHYKIKLDHQNNIFIGAY